MDTAYDTPHQAAHQAKRPARFANGLSVALAPVPLPVVNFFLNRLVKAIGQNRPEIFSRLEGHHHKWFLIDATNLPFVFYLRPDPYCPELKSCRRRCTPHADSRISGSFLTLLGMIDGRYDGDALFFTRDLCVQGDTEAVVCLRNALDDVDGSIADDVASFFGAPGKRFLRIARKLNEHIHERRHA